jgi:hypothetical protein
MRVCPRTLFIGVAKLLRATLEQLAHFKIASRPSSTLPPYGSGSRGPWP